MSKFSQNHRYMSIALACFQNMTLGGIFFGKFKRSMSAS